MARDDGQTRYLGLCLFCRDEHDYLREWIDYHFLIGVDHVFIIDNESRTPIADAVAEDVAAGRVTVWSWPGRSRGRQCAAYLRCLEQAGHQFRWLGFIDTDEFLVPKWGYDLQHLLWEFEPYGGLVVNWLCFGSNGRAVAPTSVLEGFTRRAEKGFGPNMHVKTLARCDRVEPRGCTNPHHFRYRPGFHAVNEEHRVARGALMDHASTRIQINHYITRSRAECIEKLERGGGNGAVRGPGYFEDNDRNEVEDRSALACLARRQLLQRSRLTRQVYARIVDLCRDAQPRRPLCLGEDAAALACAALDAGVSRVAVAAPESANTTVARQVLQDGRLRWLTGFTTGRQVEARLRDNPHELYLVDGLALAKQVLTSPATRRCIAVVEPGDARIADDLAGRDPRLSVVSRAKAAAAPSRQPVCSGYGTNSKPLSGQDRVARGCRVRKRRPFRP